MKYLLLVIIVILCSLNAQVSAQKEDFTQINKQIDWKLIVNLPNFSYAGYGYGEKNVPIIKKKIYNVTNFGIKPNSEKDQTQIIQTLIDSIGASGGGVLFFPSGKYNFNMNPNEKQFLKINYSNIVLRGEVGLKLKTIFYNGNNLTQNDASPWLSPALIQTGFNLQNTLSFWGLDYLRQFSNDKKAISTSTGKVNEDIQVAKVIAKVTASAKEGQDVLRLNSTAKIKAGDIILLGMYADENGTLIKNILKPIQTFYDFEQSAINASAMQAPSYQWLVAVEKVLSNNAIKLKQPLRRSIDLKYNPVIGAAPMLTEIGLEDISFQSAWNGYYCHHGCDKNNPDESKEMDYGWTAINFCRVSNGWIKNVSIENFTNPIYLLDSRNITVQNIDLNGANGHSGIKIYSHSCDNLIKDIRVNTNYTHVLSGEGNAYGNVFSNVFYKVKDGKPGYFDSHGFSDRRFSPPSQNLFENIIGMNKINGGGAANNLPHTANYNTWWNVEMKDFSKSNTEIFYSWMPKENGVLNNNLSHHMYPKSILIGVFQSGVNLSVAGNVEDIQDDWIYTENLNKGFVYPQSLYEAQLALRKKLMITK
jgi:hypothetical protein